LKVDHQNGHSLTEVNLLYIIYYIIFSTNNFKKNNVILNFYIIIFFLKYIYIYIGISFWGADEGKTGSIYLLGNIFIWYSGTISIFIYLTYFFFFEMAKQSKTAFTKKGINIIYYLIL